MLKRELTNLFHKNKKNLGTFKNVCFLFIPWDLSIASVGVNISMTYISNNFKKETKLFLTCLIKSELLRLPRLCRI